MSLALPPPVNGHDNSRPMPVDAAPARPSAALLDNIIYPSREIRSIIDKTAIHIAKSPLPQQLEDKIREHQKNDPKFSFLRDSDPFHRYYRYMIERVKEDGEDAVLAGNAATTAAAVPSVVPEGEEAKDQVAKEREEMRAREQKKALERLKEPEAWEWALDLPNVTAKDL